jgi:hypothetical protein
MGSVSLMTIKEKQFHQGLVAAGVAAALLGFAGTAAAQQQPRPQAMPSGTSSFGQPAPQPRSMGMSRQGQSGIMAPGTATMFQDSASGRTFVLERRQDVFLLQFQGDNEVYVLEPRNAPGGDVILRYNGRDVLRVTERGNLISYYGSPAGVPADAMLASAAPTRSLAPPPADSITSVLRAAKQQLSQFTGHEVTVFGANAFAGHEAWVAEALRVIVKGVEGAETAGRAVRTVRLQISDIPSVSFRDGELLIGVNPSGGYRGRLSSDAIEQKLRAGGM